MGSETGPATTVRALLVAGLFLGSQTAAAAEASTAALKPAPPLDYFLVVTGGELLEGAYPDGHTHFTVRTLRPLGCRCVGSLIVDDQPDAIQRALRFATNSAALVVVTGGLGPTPNDITRETLAEFTGIPLREHPDALADIARRSGQPPDQLRPNLKRQALVPSRGGYLRNPNGTAPGLVFDANPLTIVALPGPPRELQPMVRDELAPLLRQRFGVHDFGAAITLRFVGAGQSLIDQTLKDHVAIDPDVVVTSLFEGGRVDFTFTLPGNSDADRARLRQLEAAIRNRLGSYFYADDGASLEEIVLRTLARSQSSIALAEIGTAGCLAAALGSCRDPLPTRAGAFVAPDAPAMFRLLDGKTRPPVAAEGLAGEPLARALADALAERLPGAAAVVTGPVEGSGSASMVWVVVKRPPDRADAFAVSLRDGAPSSAITPILDRWRKLLP